MHQHDHSHGDIAGTSKSRMLVTVALNLAITAAEVVGGLLANSLALLSDAVHNLSDTAAVFLAWIAIRISEKKSTGKMTFGYRRIQILAAFFNALVLIAISAYLIYEAIHRFYNPQPVEGTIMFIVAVVGLLGNLISVFLLRKNKGDNLNVRAAYLHLLGDTLSSVVVIAGGVLIIYFNIYWIDPLVTILIGLYIGKATYSVLKETIGILMQSAPPDMDIGEISAELETIDKVENIHHIHLWRLDDRSVHFECHCDISEDMNVSRTDELRRKLEDRLHEKFDIHHVTIQIEYNICHSKSAVSQDQSRQGCD
ncbi:MAG: cation diffusion facilitator family transporter [Candidatus Kapaibacterium sp.]